MFSRQPMADLSSKTINRRVRVARQIAPVINPHVTNRYDLAVSSLTKTSLTRIFTTSYVTRPPGEKTPIWRQLS